MLLVFAVLVYSGRGTIAVKSVCCRRVWVKKLLLLKFAVCLVSWLVLVLESVLYPFLAVLRF